MPFYIVKLKDSSGIRPMEGLWIFLVLLLMAIAGIVYGLITWPSNQSRKEKPMVLVVDDDVLVRELLQEALGEHYRVEVEKEGYAGLSAVMEGKLAIDLVITDLKMPGMDGMALLRKLPKEIPVVVISGYLDDPEFRDVLEDMRPTAVFEKPFQVAELQKVVQVALKRIGKSG